MNRFTRATRISASICLPMVAAGMLLTGGAYAASQILAASTEQSSMQGAFRGQQVQPQAVTSPYDHGVRVVTQHVSPALWHADINGSSVTLLGSVHMLPPKIDWQSDAVKTAFASADIVVFEAPLGGSFEQALANARDTAGSLPAGQNLNAVLSADAQARLKKVAHKYKWSEATLADKRPWLVAMLLDMAEMRQSGLRVSGPDVALMRQAKQDGKAVRYLETVDQQVALLAPSDPAIERQLLESRLKGFATANAEKKALIDAWGKGDTAAVEAAVSPDMALDPALKARFLTERNQNWAKQVVAMAGEKKNILVVVGVAHMVGKDSVPALLRAEGYKVTGP